MSKKGVQRRLFSWIRNLPDWILRISVAVIKVANVEDGEILRQYFDFPCAFQAGVGQSRFIYCNHISWSRRSKIYIFTQSRLFDERQFIMLCDIWWNFFVFLMVVNNRLGANLPKFCPTAVTAIWEINFFITKKKHTFVPLYNSPCPTKLSGSLVPALTERALANG